MSATPFLKWAGGKRWLAPRLAAALSIPPHLRLVEPFVGSGAVFFYLHPKRALLADCNEELIGAYKGIRNNPEAVIARLSILDISKTTFERIRISCPNTDVGRAVRMIYLNRTAFNGLYRVNQRGSFNVPFGCKLGTKICDSSALRTASELLAGAALRSQDFRRTLASVNPDNDLIYVDPPYTVKHDNNGFRRYNDQIFSWSDQEELAIRLIALAKRGARIILSNAHHRAIRTLYPAGLFYAFEITRRTCMAADPQKRGHCSEWLIVSHGLCNSRLQLRNKLRFDIR